MSFGTEHPSNRTQKPFGGITMKSSYDLINNKTVQKDEDMNLPSRRQHPHPHQRNLFEAVYQWRFQKRPYFITRK